MDPKHLLSKWSDKHIDEFIEVYQTIANVKATENAKAKAYERDLASIAYEHLVEANQYISTKLITNKHTLRPSVIGFQSKTKSEFLSESVGKGSSTFFFPKEIHDSIVETQNKFFVEYPLFEITPEKKVRIQFVVVLDDGTTEEGTGEKKADPKNIEAIFNERVKYIYMWIYIASKYSTGLFCSSEEINLCFHFTEFFKEIPSSFEEIISTKNVNTGFTTPCAYGNDITIYRKEEWFKVFLHESFHHFGLDFATATKQDLEEARRSSGFDDLFKGIQSDFLLFETYTEIWADLWNVMFCCFYSNSSNLSSSLSYSSSTKKSFVEDTTASIELEREFAIFQCAKVLKHNQLESWEQLISDDPAAVEFKRNHYKEKTNVFVYYIARAALFYNLEELLHFCRRRHGVGEGKAWWVFSGSSTSSKSIVLFLEIIVRNAKDPGMANLVDKYLDFLIRRGHLSSSDQMIILKTLRMTLFDFL